MKHPTSLLRLGILIILAGVLGAAWAGEGLGWFGQPTAAGVPEDAVARRRDQLETQISRLLDRLTREPANAAAAYQLGEALLQKARESGDPTFYGRAEAALTRSWELDPSSGPTAGAIGNLALARHQFSDALAWGERARALAPASAFPHGVVGDALIELGRYDEAFDAFDAMVKRRPDLASYSRVSYARELQGDLPGAIATMQRAADAGASGSEARAWTLVQLGNLHFLAGDSQQALDIYRRADFEFPGYIYATAGAARVLAAAGDYEQAIRLLDPVVSRLPIPELVIQLGDTYQVAGRTAEAERQYALVRVMIALLQANGVDADVELALFELDHGGDLATAINTLEQQHARRPTVKIADTLAWAYHLAGNDEAALRLIRDALRLGTVDPLLHYHAGKIFARAGLEDEARDQFARAWRLQPQYSLIHAADLAFEYRTRQGAAE